MAHAGWDWVTVDAEHSPMTIEMISGSQPLEHIGLRFEGSFRRGGVNSNDHLTYRQCVEPWHGHLAAVCEANSHRFGPSVASSVPMGVGGARRQIAR
jgi:hypothetical protein